MGIRVEIGLGCQDKDTARGMMRRLGASVWMRLIMRERIESVHTWNLRIKDLMIDSIGNVEERKYLAMTKDKLLCVEGRLPEQLTCL